MSLNLQRQSTEWIPTTHQSQNIYLTNPCSNKNVQQQCWYFTLIAVWGLTADGNVNPQRRIRKNRKSTLQCQRWTKSTSRVKNQSNTASIRITHKMQTWSANLQPGWSYDNYWHWFWLGACSVFMLYVMHLKTLFGLSLVVTYICACNIHVVPAKWLVITYLLLFNVITTPLVLQGCFPGICITTASAREFWICWRLVISDW